MIAAMLDVSRETPAIAPIFWAGALIACAVAVTVVSGRNSSRSDRGIRSLVADGALGCLSMVPMVALMGSGIHDATVSSASAIGGGHHGGTGSGSAALLLLLPAIYGAVTLVRAHRGGWTARAQHITMGSGTLLMTAAMLL